MAQQKSNTIVFVASIFRDLVAVCPRFPRPGETLAGSEFFTGFGGKGANQCVMAARLGSRCAVVGRLGGDSHGTDYRRHLEEEGVDTTFLGTEQSATTGIATILVESRTGENLIVVVPGANALLSPAHLSTATPLLAAGAQVVVVTLELPLPAVREALSLGKQHGTRTVLNAAPAPAGPLDPALLHLVDILVVNQTEAELLAGEGEGQAGNRLTHLVPSVIVTLGGAGAEVWRRGGAGCTTVSCPALPSASVVDTTGAGDAFVGSLAYFLANTEQKLEEMVKKACRLATITVQKKGTQASYPVRDEVDHLL